MSRDHDCGGGGRRKKGARGWRGARQSEAAAAAAATAATKRLTPAEYRSAGGPAGHRPQLVNGSAAVSTMLWRRPSLPSRPPRRRGGRSTARAAQAVSTIGALAPNTAAGTAPRDSDWRRRLPPCAWPPPVKAHKGGAGHAAVGRRAAASIPVTEVGEYALDGHVPPALPTAAAAAIARGVVHHASAPLTSILSSAVGVAAFRGVGAAARGALRC